MFDAFALMLTVIGYVFLTWVLVAGLGVIYITLIHIQMFAREQRLSTTHSKLPFNVKDGTKSEHPNSKRSV